MCYHITFEKKRIRNQAQIAGKTFVFDMDESDINGFDFKPHPIITNEGMLQLESCNWGLIPAKTKDATAAKIIRSKTLNAKSETVFELQSFKDVAGSNRCLVPVTGFLEWKHVGNTKQPFHITVPGQEVFCLAGIWDSWLNKANGEIVKSFSILTTAANELMAEIHNTKKRMPVIIMPQDQLSWLKPSIEKHEFEYLSKAISSEVMHAESVIRNNQQLWLDF